MISCRNNPIKDKFSSELAHFWKFENRACFYYLPIIFSNLKSVDIALYFNSNLNKKAADWFLNEIKEWGFEFDFADNFKGYHSRANFVVRVKRQSTILKTLIILTLLRYLDKSESLHFIVNKTFEWKNKFKDLCSFELFQIAHIIFLNFNSYSYNWNHALLSPHLKYKISTLDLFKFKLNSSKDNGVEKLLFSVELSKDEQQTIKSMLVKENLYGVLQNFKQGLSKQNEEI